MFILKLKYKRLVGACCLALPYFMPINAIAQTPQKYTYAINGGINALTGKITITNIQSGQGVDVTGGSGSTGQFKPFSIKYSSVEQATSPYNLVFTSPPHQTCTHDTTTPALSGNVGPNNLGGIIINCVNKPYTVSGTVDFSNVLTSVDVIAQIQV